MSMAAGVVVEKESKYRLAPNVLRALDGQPQGGVGGCNSLCYIVATYVVITFTILPFLLPFLRLCFSWILPKPRGN